MFWKKKSNDKGAGKKLFKNPVEVRGSFRVFPSKEKPIVLKVGGLILKAVDISAGGISFASKVKPFELGTKYPIEIVLPVIERGKYKGSSQIIKTSTEILKIDDGKIYRGKITGLSTSEEDEIHSYILARQKEELAQKRRREL